MKKILISILFLFLVFNLSAQRNVRNEIRKGNEAYKEQRYGAAEESYVKALKEDELNKNTSSKEASFNLANAYYKQQRWDDALMEYQHYLTLEGKDDNANPNKMSNAWSNIGNTYLKKKAAEKPAPDLQMQEPQEGQKEDNLKSSMEAYKNALRLNPTDDDTRYNLAVVKKMIQDEENQKDQNKDKDKQDQDKKDQKDQNKDKDKQDQDKKDQKDQNKDKDKQDQDKKDQKDQQQENQMSQENMQQILQAIEQDEKATQEKVQQNKANEQKQKQQENKKQNKDW